MLSRQAFPPVGVKIHLGDTANYLVLRRLTRISLSLLARVYFLLAARFHGFAFLNEEFLLFVSLSSIFFYGLSTTRSFFETQLADYVNLLKFFSGKNIDFRSFALHSRKLSFSKFRNYRSVFSLWSHLFFNKIFFLKNFRVVFDRKFFTQETSRGLALYGALELYSNTFLVDSLFSMFRHSVLAGLSLTGGVVFNQFTSRRFLFYFNQFTPNFSTESDAAK